MIYLLSYSMPLHYSLPVVLGFSLQNLMNARQVFYPRATHNLPHAVNLMSQHKQKVPINREVRQHMWYLISASRGWEGSNHTACSLCLGVRSNSTPHLCTQVM